MTNNAHGRHFLKVLLCAVKFKITMFKVGQKVVCIKAVDVLIENEIYIISWVGKSHDNKPAVRLVELKHSRHNEGITNFYAWRFREIDDTGVDELLCKLIEEVEANELVSA